MSQVRSWLAVSAVMMLAVSVGYAQKPPKLAQVYNVKGKLQNISGDTIFLNDDAGKLSAVIKVPPDGTVSVVGLADPSFLTEKDIRVQINCVMNTKLEVQTPIKEAIVLDATSTLPLGFAIDGPEAAVALKKDKNAFVNYVIRGKVQKVADGELHVSTPKVIKVPIDPEAKFNLSTTDYTLAQPGDEVVVLDGKDGGSQGEVKAVLGQRVQINAANPIQPKKKKLPPGKKPMAPLNK